MSFMLVGVGIVALIGGIIVLRDCWLLISGAADPADEEGEATRAADARQAEAERTGSYFPPEKSP